MKEIRPEKKAILAEIRGLIESSSYMILVGYDGLTVEGLTDLRNRIRPSGSRLTVVRNTFLERIVGDLGWDGAESMIKGQVAIITGTDEMANVSKILKGFATETKIMVIKGGTMDGDVLSSLLCQRKNHLRGLTIVDGVIHADKVDRFIMHNLGKI